MKRFTQIDSATGEEIGSFVAVVRTRQKSLFQRHFTMNQSALIKIATELSGEEMRVLMVLLSDLDYENYIQVQQVSISEMLEMQKPNVTRAIKGLVRLGVLFEGPKIGRSKSYRLNPNYGWKGSSKNHKQAVRELESRKQLAGITEVIEGGLAKQNDPYTSELLTPETEQGE